MRWPLSALACWLLGWGMYIMARRLGLGPWEAAGLGTLISAMWAWRAATVWRRWWMAAGFPLSWLLTAPAGAWPAWVWLLPLGLLWLLYPRQAWKDAPLFPTEAEALQDLPDAVPLAPGSRILDAGCGVGHGLEALRMAYPLAQCEGIERSRLLAWWCARRCPWARVRSGDLWADSWASYDAVYLFQRPETMPRAAQKAVQEMRKDAWLISLEFEIPEQLPDARLSTPGGKPIWAYRIGGMQF